VRISELAEQAGVPTTTVRYYERVGLLAPPQRTAAGYRDYDEDAATRLVFVTRARHIGLSCEQIGDLLPIWDGANCCAAHGTVLDLVERKKVEVAERIDALHHFADQLSEVEARLHAAPPPSACRSDLGCCLPETDAV
jgi:DNA-binding transcriptional MerR regulator